MSTDADRAAAEKAEAEKKAAEDAAATAAAAASAWPIGGYNSLIPLLLISVLAMLAPYVDVSAISVVCAYMVEYQHVRNTVNAMLVIYTWIKLIEKLPIYSAIQKPTMCRNFSASGFAAALKPDKFTGTYFKRWQTRTTLWLTAMNVFWVAGVPSTATIAPEQEKAFREATVVFLGAVLSVIGDKLVDAYLHVRVAKDLWEALESKFGATDAGSEMYVIEQFHDYKMVENRSVLEQAHEIICIAKELELLKCDLPGKFVAGCIIAKLPNSWRNFATTLKHQRREFSVEDVIGHLSVEQNSRAKDSHGKGVEGSKCLTCVQSKQPRKPHKAAEERHLAPLELIHSDLCEMNGVLTKGGKKYFMTLIDDSTRYCYVYLLNTKDEALHYFKIYKAEVENQLEKKIKRVRSDRGGEYFSNEFDSFCAEHGIIHERTPPYSPQSNGVAERKNRTLTDLVNAMLDTSGLSKAWWGEAILTSCHVLNKVPTKDNEVTPYEQWSKRRTTLSYLRTWGCLAKVNVPIPKKRKLGPKTVDCVNLGYAKNNVGYRFLVVKSEVPDV